MAAAVERREWERIALCLLLGLARTLALAPPATLEDVIDALEGERDDDRDR
jgi:hypothetical protein